MPTTLSKQRAAFVLGGIALAAVPLSLPFWSSNPDAHTVMETVATALAFFVAAIVLLRYYSSRDDLLLLLVGAGFGGTFLLDLVHAVLTSQGLAGGLPSALEQLSPWSWFPSRVFLPLMLILAWGFERRRGAIRGAGRVVYAMVLLLAAAVLVVFLVVPLPSAHSPGFPPRPQELVVALLFGVAIIAYLKLDRSRGDPLFGWIAVSLGVGFAAQLFMSFSRETHDPVFDAAHLLKIASYLLVLLGAGVSAFRLFRGAVETERDVRLVNERLRREIAERERLTAEQRLLGQVAEVANEAAPMEAVGQTVHLVCSYTDWPVGHAYVVSDDGTRLEDTDIWHGGSEAFRQATAQMDLTRESTLLRRVVSGGAPVWISDVTAVKDFVRASEAGTEGVTSVFAVPVTSGDDVVAVLEFFGRKAQEPDRTILDLMERVGDRLGRAIERDMARRALQQSERRLFQFLEHLPIAVFITDGEGSPYYANRVSSELLGRGIDPATTKYEMAEVYDVLVAGTNERYAFEELPHARAVRGEIVHVDNIEIRRPDGTRIPIEVWAEPIRDAEGRITHAIAVFSDISERWAAARESERHAGELARSNEELERFAYVASHDLQEPLRMVTGYVQLLSRRYGDALDDDAREFIGYAVDGAERMRQLIDDLLTYSRIGREGTPPVATESGRAFESVLHNLEALIEERGADVSAGDLPVVVVDPGQLVQLLQNLVSNGIKFADSSPSVRVSAERDGDMWRFAVSDNGIGIDPQYTDRIFAIFQRLHARDEYPGTGVGLSICQKIVERHGGTIWVESQPGEGSTFFFTLPGPDSDTDQGEAS